jgi:hypothetical protein
VGESYTPEEKAQFAAWLQSKRSIAVDGSELRQVYLPAMQAAGLVDMESDLLWEFAQRGISGHDAWKEWLQLQRQRVQLDGVGAKLETLAETAQPRYRQTIFQGAAEIYCAQGDDAAELRALDHSRAVNNSRYYQLLLNVRPQELVERASGTLGLNMETGNSAAQFLITHGKIDLALAGIAARSNGMPPVWKKAYTGITGLYLREHTAPVRASFEGALGGDATIGERIAHPADRDEQLAGEVWFYYGSRYG